MLSARARDVVFVVALVLLALPRDAQAYLDPGTGSLIVQTIVAGVAAAAYGFRHYLMRALSLLRGRGGTKPAHPDEAPPSQP
jgi:hypothetical protein